MSFVGERAHLSLVGEFLNRELEREFQSFDFQAAKWKILGFALVGFATVLILTVAEAANRLVSPEGLYFVRRKHVQLAP